MLTQEPLMIPDKFKNTAAIRILIVEDSPVQAEMLMQTLVAEGYSVEVAKDGLEGLEKTRRDKPALIISDIHMPGMDGFEMCMKIKNDAELRNIPVMLLSQLSKADDVIRGLAACADNYITKPYDQELLLMNVKNMLSSNTASAGTDQDTSFEVDFAGIKHTFTSNSRRIMHVLLTTYENTIRQNRKLSEARYAIKELNEQLDQRVQEKTAALRAEIKSANGPRRRCCSAKSAIKNLSNRLSITFTPLKCATVKCCQQNTLQAV